MVQQVLSTCYRKTGYDIDFILSANQSTLNNMETCTWSIDWITPSLSVKNTTKMDKDLLIQLFFIKREWNHIMMQFHLHKPIEEIEHSISQVLILCYNLLDQSFNRFVKLFENIKEIEKPKKHIYFPFKQSRKALVNLLTTEYKMIISNPQSDFEQLIAAYGNKNNALFSTLLNDIWDQLTPVSKNNSKAKKMIIQGDSITLNPPLSYDILLEQSDIELFIQNKNKKVLAKVVFEKQFTEHFFGTFCINYLLKYNIISKTDNFFTILHYDWHSCLNDFISKDDWSKFVNEFNHFISFDFHCKNSFDFLANELPFAYFHDESNQPFSQSWIDALFYISNDSKHVRLTPHTKLENLASKFGFIELKQQICNIDYAEPLPQLHSWSIYRVMNNNRSSIEQSFFNYHNIQPNEKHFKHLSRQANYFLRKYYERLAESSNCSSNSDFSWIEYFSKPVLWSLAQLEYYPVNHNLMQEPNEQNLKQQLFVDIESHDEKLKKENKHLSLGIIKEEIWYFLKTRISRQKPDCETYSIKPDCTFDVIALGDRIISKVEEALSTFANDYQNLNDKFKINPSTCESERDLLISYTKDNIKPVERSDIFENPEYSSNFYYYLKQRTKFLLKQSKFSECSSVWIKASELLMDDQPIISVRYLKRAIKSFGFTHDDSEYKKIADLCFKNFQHFNSPDSKDWKMADYMLKLIGKIPFKYLPYLKLTYPQLNQWRRNFYNKKSEMFDPKTEPDLLKQLEYCQNQIDYLQWLGWKSFHGDHSEKNIHKGSVIVSQLVVNLRHLLDQGITRFARKCIGIPNNTFIPQFNFTSLSILEKLLEQKDYTKKLSDYPEIEVLVEDINTKDWYKIIISISNRCKHICLDIPLKEDYEEFFARNRAGSFPIVYFLSPEDENKYTTDAVALLNGSAKEIRSALEKFHTAS